MFIVVMIFALGVFALVFFTIFRTIQRGSRGMVDDVLAMRRKIIESTQLTCESCGTKRPDTELRCPECGARAR